MLTVNHFSLNSQINNAVSIDTINSSVIKKLVELFKANRFNLNNYDESLKDYSLCLEKLGHHSTLFSILKSSSDERVSIGLFSNGMDIPALTRFIDRCGSVESFLNRPEEPFVLSYIFDYKACEFISTLHELEKNIAYTIFDIQLELF